MDIFTSWNTFWTELGGAIEAIAEILSSSVTSVAVGLQFISETLGMAGTFLVDQTLLPTIVGVSGSVLLSMTVIKLLWGR